MALFVASCKPRQVRCDEAKAKAVRLGCLSLDSSTKIITKYIKGDSITTKVPVFVPVTVIDSLWRIDTCYTKKRAETLLKSAKIAPLDTQSSRFKIHAEIKDGYIVLDIKEKDRTDTTEIKNNNVTIKPVPANLKWWQNIDWWMIAFFIQSAIFIAYIWKKK